MRKDPPIMLSTVQRAGARAVAIAMLALSLAGCGAGAITQTATQASAVNGVAGQVGSIVVRNATIECPPNLAGAAYQPGGAAPLSMSLVNISGTADKLVSVSSPVAGSGQVVGDATLPGGTAVTVGNNSGAASQALAPRTISVKLAGLVGPVRAGLTYPVTMTFQRAGQLTVQVPVGYPEGPNAERKD